MNFNKENPFSDDRPEEEQHEDDEDSIPSFDSDEELEDF
jgi:hypothetical protein